MIDPSLNYQQKQTKTKYVQPQLQQQVRYSIFISCLSLVSYNILKENLQIVQIKLKVCLAPMLKLLTETKHVQQQQ